MFRLLLQAVLLIAVIAISESNETQQDDVEKRAQQTLADVIKELNSLKTVVNKGLNGLKTGMNKELNGLKTGMNSMKTRIQRIESRRLFALPKGRDGRDGLPGPPGKCGAPGPRGRDGRDGFPGPRGRDGKSGAPGPRGHRGSPGRDGKNGTQSLRGPRGSQGPPGQQGSRGPRGSQGPPGQQGPKGPPGRNGGGVEYIRWGKTSCPAGADKVYKGLMGGEYYSHPGGASNYVCLPENPKYLNYKPGHQIAAFMYGTEYEVHSFNPFKKSNLQEHDAPCVACHVKTRSAKLMIPATYQCPSGWTREYYGYLMSAHYAHKHSSEYICVDLDAEAVSSSSSRNDNGGALLYPVEGRCGSLPCSPYVQGRELTCAVCTK